MIAGYAVTRRPAQAGRVMLFLAAIFGTVSCVLPLQDYFAVGPGALQLELRGIQSRTISPGVSMVPAYFELSGDGPDETSFFVSTADDSVTLEGLDFGTWLITAKAYSATDQLIGEGSAQIEIRTNETAVLFLDIAPAAGTGELSLSAAWNGNLLLNPSVSALLTDGAGVSRQVDFMLTGDDGATSHLADVTAGYHTLTMSLLDRDTAVAGLTEVVRILTGETTTGSFFFERLNKPGEAIEIRADSFTLAWDPPAGTSVTGYRIYYRPRGTYSWQVLGEAAPQAEPTLTVTSSTLPYGTYEFAVSSLDGVSESVLHASMADDAFPATGWYVVWSPAT